MGKIEAYKFLDDLVKDSPQGEWKYIQIAIRKKDDHWEIQTFDPPENPELDSPLK